MPASQDLSNVFIVNDQAANEPQLPAVGIGILNWNGQKYLEQFLPFLYNISYANATIYVLDNQSSDGSIAYLKQHHPTVKIIETGGNYGVPGGYNIGFAQMPEPYLLMLNSDVEVASNFLEPLVALMEADKAIAMVQSKLLSFQNRPQFEYGGAAGGSIDVLGYTFCRGRIFETVETDHHQYGTSEVFWAGGACALIRKSAYEKVGGMYNWFFMHFEEIDLCWRFHTANYKVMFCNESVAWHVGGGTLSYQSPRKTFYNFKNNLVMVFRNSPWWYLLWWTPIRFVLDLLAAFKYLLANNSANSAAVIKAWFGFFKWLLWDASKNPAKPKALSGISVVMKQSIIWSYYLQKKQHYSQLNKHD